MNSSFLRLPFFYALALVAIARAAEPISYNEHIRPILADNCFACHGSDAAHRKAELRLDQFDSATVDRNGFRALVPGDIANSEAWLRIISTDPDEIMPPPDSHKPPLKPAQRDLIRRWIEQGAVYQNHWAFEPISRPAIPVTQLSTLNSQPSPNPLDAFLRPDRPPAHARRDRRLPLRLQSQSPRRDRDPRHPSPLLAALR
ncbi:MAG: hypothetical protein NTZ29_10280 [Verrucomicrobia bacterium]|nr:hypothetical protein [Verrucomicrobiota bacterium]